MTEVRGYWYLNGDMTLDCRLSVVLPKSGKPMSLTWGVNTEGFLVARIKGEYDEYSTSLTTTLKNMPSNTGDVLAYVEDLYMDYLYNQANQCRDCGVS